MEKEGEHKTPANQNFLHLLRASNGDFETQNGDATNEEQNANTLRTANVDKQKALTNNVSNLYEPPPPMQNHAELRKKSPGKGDANFEEQNADTLRTANVDKQKAPTNNFSNLFVPPPPMQNTAELKKQPPPAANNGPQPAVESARTRSPIKPTLRTLKKAQPLSSRGRSVSFDKHALSKTEFDTIMQPVLPLAETIEFSRASSNQSHPREVHLQRLPSDRTLTIDDLLTSGPYETEAETNILRAFEEHQQQTPNHQRHQSETSTIFSGVPDTLAHDFSIEEENSESIDKQNDGSLSSRQQDNLSEEEQFDKQARPLLRQKGRHRRKESVGDRLVGLTLAMQTLDVIASGPGIERSTDGNEVTESVSMDTASASQQHGRGRLASLDEIIEGAVEEDANEKSKIDVESQAASNDPQSTQRRGQLRQSRRSSVFIGAKVMVEESEVIWKSFFRSQKDYIRRYIKNVGLLLVILIGAASILFYPLNNPLTKGGDQASTSWYLLFCARQIVTLSLALASQIIIVDFLGVSTKVLLRLVGQYFTLLIIMSRGWPFTVFMWSLYDFGMIYGDRPFSKHWGYWQSAIELFNETNPSGNDVASVWNRRVLFIALFVSLASALKRFIMGLYLGRQTFGHYGEKLAKVMSKMLLVSQVAHLARRMKKASISTPMPKLPENFGVNVAMLRQVDSDEDGSSVESTLRSSGTPDKTLDMSKTDPLTGRLDDLEKAKLNQLLGQWEEPDRVKSGMSNSNSISEVLRFRNALTFINDNYPFSFAFGLADSREATVHSAQEVYKCLLSLTPFQINLQFETIAHIAIRNDGSIDTEKAKEAIKVFRPDREGNLALLDFIKSIDSIYKEFRLLQASIENSSQIDRKFESIFNIAFYGFVMTIVLSQVGVDPLALFLSLSSVIFAFAFMIGSASSKYFEGLLFILARRPYGIGDIIHISNVEQDTSRDGSLGWIVNNVTLTQTSATWVPTLEVASFSNGSLSSSRIINWARSPNARFNINLSFPVSTNYEKIEIFKRAVEEYLKVRPREWLALNGFRVNRIFSEKGYMDVVITLQHRDSWQNIGQILDSKSNLVTYCHEVQKKLGMQYTAPPLPVELSDSNRGILSLLDNQAITTSNSQADQNNSEAQEEHDDFQVEQFRTMALKKYNIRFHS